jgi:ADP-ribose pyrophosphatase
MHKKDVYIKDQQCLYQGFLSIKQYQLQHKLFQGGLSEVLTREVVIRPNAAAVLPYDPQLDRVVLIEQFRTGALEEDNPWLIEIVAGLIEPPESPDALVHREAQEEAGLTLLDLWPIYQYWSSPGGSNERISLFCGRVDASDAGGFHGLKEEQEDIRVFTAKTAEAFTMVEEGKICNAISLIALQCLQLNKAKVDAKWNYGQRG